MPSVPLISCPDTPAGFKPLTVNHETGIKRYYQEIDGGKRIRVIATQSVDKVLDANQKDKFDPRGRMGRDDSAIGFLAARVPTMLAEQWRYTESGELLDREDYDKAITRNLNSSDFSKLRVGEFNL